MSRYVKNNPKQGSYKPSSRSNLIKRASAAATLSRKARAANEIEDQEPDYDDFDVISKKMVDQSVNTSPQTIGLSPISLKTRPHVEHNTPEAVNDRRIL